MQQIRHACLFLLFLAFSAPSVHACSCFPTTMNESYARNDIVIHAKILSTYANTSESNVLYNAEIQHLYKGCAVAKQSKLIIATPQESSFCGVSLEPPNEYLLLGNLQSTRLDDGTDVQTLTVINCEKNSEWDFVPPETRQLLLQLQNQAPPCPTTCKNHAECKSTGRFCARGSCRRHGTCNTLRDCLNPNNIYHVNTACTGYLRCNNGRCGVKCSEFSCPPNAPLQNCSNVPCKCARNSGTCVKYSCGSCQKFCF